MPTDPDEWKLKSLTAVVHLYCQFSTISLGLGCHAHDTFTVTKHIAYKNLCNIQQGLYGFFF